MYSFGLFIFASLWIPSLSQTNYNWDKWCKVPNDHYSVSAQGALLTKDTVTSHDLVTMGPSMTSGVHEIEILIEQCVDGDMFIGMMKESKAQVANYCHGHHGDAQNYFLYLYAGNMERGGGGYKGFSYTNVAAKRRIVTGDTLRMVLDLDAAPPTLTYYLNGAEYSTWTGIAVDETWVWAVAMWRINDAVRIQQIHTSNPTLSPTLDPTLIPTSDPTAAPSLDPTLNPTSVCPDNFPYRSSAHPDICFDQQSYATNAFGPCGSWCTYDLTVGSGCGSNQNHLCEFAQYIKLKDGEQCVFGRIKNEATCRNASAALGLYFRYSYDSPNDPPGCNYANDHGKGVNFNEALTATGWNPRYAEICDHNVEASSVCADTISVDITTYDQNLCVPVDGGQVTYVGRPCGDNGTDIEWISASAIDIRGGEGLTSAQCDWDWLAHASRGFYAGSCGVSPTMNGWQQLPTSCTHDLAHSFDLLYDYGQTACHLDYMIQKTFDSNEFSCRRACDDDDNCRQFEFVDLSTKDNHMFSIHPIPNCYTYSACNVTRTSFHHGTTWQKFIMTECDTSLGGADSIADIYDEAVCLCEEYRSVGHHVGAGFLLDRREPLTDILQDYVELLAEAKDRPGVQTDAQFLIQWNRRFEFTYALAHNYDHNLGIAKRIWRKTCRSILVMKDRMVELAQRFN